MTLRCCLDGELDVIVGPDGTEMLIEWLGGEGGLEGVSLCVKSIDSLMRQRLE